ncbi:MAG TPA: PAS domain S-box protein [Candidatus Dormibacteraeota bacterium]|nr:PAS domain S-box protein [Candidatus Dormibacteraeota bacterium]
MRKVEIGAGRATNGVVKDLRMARAPEGLGLEDLAALVTATADGITVLDSDRRVVYANPAACKLLGYSLEQLMGLDGLMLVPESERQTAMAVLASAGRGQPQAVAGAAWRSDGSELEVEVTTSTLELRSNRYILVASRDVTERRRQARQAAALAQAAASVVLGDSIEATVEAIAECALRGTRALAAWVMLDSKDHVGAWLGAAGVPDGFREHFRAKACERIRSIFRQALTAQRTVIYADARQQVEDELEPKCQSGPLMALPWQACAFVPLAYRGAIVGMLVAVYREGEMPNEAETTFLAALADQAATATANAQLMTAAREKVAFEERQRLARELHDSVSQSLYGIQVAAGMARARLEKDPAAAAEPIDHVMELADAGQAEMRALIFELRADSLETEGLVTNLDTHIKAVRARNGIAGQTIVPDEPGAPIEVKHALYRIAQEALRNTVKHARARRVDVRLETRPSSVVLEIADDGVGFDPNGRFPGHLGLRSMRERALAVGGSLEVSSSYGRGTRIVVSVPSAPTNHLGDAKPLTLPWPAGAHRALAP